MSMPRKDVWNVPPVVRKKTAARLATVVDKLSVQHKSLNEKEWKFIQEYVSGDGKVTMKEAAIRAGYRPESASAMAHRLTHPELSPHTVAAIQSYRAELAAKYEVTYERHLRDLQIIRDKALEAGAFGAAVQAEYRRGQALGTIYIDRKEIRHGTIDSMSKEEVQRRLEEIKKMYAGPAPTALIDADTGEVVKSLSRDIDPPFDAGPLESQEESDVGP